MHLERGHAHGASFQPPNACPNAISSITFKVLRRSIMNGAHDQRETSMPAPPPVATVASGHENTPTSRRHRHQDDSRDHQRAAYMVNLRHPTIRMQRHQGMLPNREHCKRYRDLRDRIEQRLFLPPAMATARTLCRFHIGLPPLLYAAKADAGSRTQTSLRVTTTDTGWVHGIRAGTQPRGTRCRALRHLVRRPVGGTMIPPPILFTAASPRQSGVTFVFIELSPPSGA